MITKGVTNEQKTPVLFAMGDLESNLGNSATEIDLFKRIYDFSTIDYLIFCTKAKLVSADPTAYLKLEIGGTIKATHTYTGNSYEGNYTRIDCTAITGKNEIKIYHTSTSGQDTIVGGIYLGIVDA